MSKYKISLIIPVYNAEKYLDTCLASVVNQTINNDMEIIIVNDGSSDSSQSIIDSYAKKFSNIKNLVQKNQGVAAARVNGYKVATGEYVAWMDNDDIAAPEMYERLYRDARENDSDVVICNYAFYPDAVWTKKKWFNEYKGVVDWRFVNRNTVLWNKLLKKSYIDEIKFIESMKLFGEASFTLLLINTIKVSTINLDLYSYRVGHMSLSGYSNLNWFIENLSNSIKRRDSVIGTKLESKWLNYMQTLVYISYVQVLVVCAYNKDKDKYIETKKMLKTDQGIKTSLVNPIMWNNNGFMQFIVLRYVATYSYTLTRLITRAVL